MQSAYLNGREHPAELVLDPRERQPAADDQPPALGERHLLQRLHVALRV